MSDKNGRMDEEKEVKASEPKISDTGALELDEILSEDANTGRKKINLSFLEDENIYLEDEKEETTSETEEKLMAGKKKGFFKRLSKPKKVILSIFLILLSLIILLVAIVGIYFYSKIRKINTLSDIQRISTEYVDPNYEEILFDVGSEGFRDALKDWATTGNDNIMSSQDVINVLLIGADSRDGTNSGNTDVMMIVSLNKKTKQITLCSLLRDSYLYVEGKNKQAFTKLNAAFSMGENADCLIKTIEHNYKIKIDNYAMVNFESFGRIVDAMGGIEVEVTQQDSNNCYKKFGEALPVGNKVTLNGRQTVYFCRDRNYTDGDVTRTSKQRKVIEAIIDKVKGASLSDLDKYLDLLLPEIYTGYTESEILSLGMEALTNGWAKYSRKQLTVPGTDCRQAGSADMWIWVVDYQKAAHDLQMALYGKSNITLEADRKTFIVLYNEGLSESTGDGGNSGGSNDVPSTEVSTEPSTDIIETLPGEDIGIEDIPEDIPSDEVTGDTVPDIGDGGEDTPDVPDDPIDTPPDSGDTPENQGGENPVPGGEE